MKTLYWVDYWCADSSQFLGCAEYSERPEPGRGMGSTGYKSHALEADVEVIHKKKKKVLKAGTRVCSMISYFDPAERPKIKYLYET